MESCWVELFDWGEDDSMFEVLCGKNTKARGDRGNVEPHGRL